MKKTFFWTTLSLISFLLLSSCNLARGTPPPGSEAQPTGNPISAQQTSIALAVQQTQTAAGPSAPELTFTPSLTSTLTLTTTPEVPRVTVSVSTNCRTGPGEPYDIVGVLPVETPAEIVGKNASGDTWIIKLPSNPAVTCWLWGQWGTVEGDTAGLTVFTPPPTPTPAAGFSFTFLNTISCTGIYAFRFQVVNTGPLTWQSYYMYIYDANTSTSFDDTFDTFIDYTGCGAPAGELQDLTLGEIGKAGNWWDNLTYNPAGHNISATLKLCSENGLGGTCLEKSLSVTP